MSRAWKFNCRNRVFLGCILIFIICFILKQKSPPLTSKSNIPSMIDRIRTIPIIDDNSEQNLSLPQWISQYKLSHLFNFYWLKTGGYQWHLQQMINLKHISKSRKISLLHNRIYTLEHLNHHPEDGVIIDTASDPFPLIFPPLPQTASSSLNETCIRLEISHHWYPCSEDWNRTNFQNLITYGLYNVVIGNSSLNRIHYDEIIYLFDDHYKQLTETSFVTQILPRLIRLLALIPSTAIILSPYFNPKTKYINQYIDILIQRGLLHDRKRLITYNPKKSYHAHVVYSTTSPRADLILLHQILIGNQLSVQRNRILIIRNHFEPKNYDQIVQIINQFELPTTVRIQQYHERSYSIKQIAQYFRQALIVIGMPSEVLSHIIWCSSGMQIIEIGQKKMMPDYYEISLQLKFHYWLALTNQTNQIDSNDFRNLILKILTQLDN